LETYRDLVGGLMDLHMNTLNTKLNEVMKVLTVISTIFIPLTFLVGVYGMNFDFMPELKWKYGYFGVWAIMILMMAFMIRFFKYKKWF
jgi:magnesium transporter